MKAVTRDVTYHAIINITKNLDISVACVEDVERGRGLVARGRGESGESGSLLRFFPFPLPLPVSFLCLPSRLKFLGNILWKKLQEPEGTPLYMPDIGMYMFRVWLLCCFGLKTGTDFAHFGLESGMDFEGATGVYERMNVFVVSTPNAGIRKKEKYANNNSKWILRNLFVGVLI